MNESVSPSRQRLIRGGLLALVSALILSLQNVVISIIFNATSLFNTWEIGGYLRPNFGNSLLILASRMVVALPLMLAIAPRLYPKTVSELRMFLKPANQLGIVQICVCGLMLFAASLLIYIALGGVTPGIALILFFGGALLSTVLGATVVLKEPSSAWLWGALVMIFFGISAIVLPSGSIRLSGLGLLTALLSGVAFGVYTLLIRVCTRKLHPVSFSVLNFAVLLVLALLTVIGLSSISTVPAVWAIDIAPEQISSLFISSLILGVLTLAAYLTYSYAICDIGAARGMLVNAAGPALTALLSWVLIASSLTSGQLFGIFWVALAIILLLTELSNFQRLKRLHGLEPQHSSQAELIGSNLTPQKITELSQNQSLKPIALRLEPGDDVRQTLEAIAQREHIQAGFILSAVGSLSTVRLRFADAESATELSGKHEVVNLSGTVSAAGVHLHLMVSNAAGECRGGHLAAGCTVYTTLELVIGQLSGVRFERVMDVQTGFPELAIVPEEAS